MGPCFHSVTNINLLLSNIHINDVRITPHPTYNKHKSYIVHNYRQWFRVTVLDSKLGSFLVDQCCSTAAHLGLESGNVL